MLVIFLIYFIKIEQVFLSHFITIWYCQKDICTKLKLWSTEKGAVSFLFHSSTLTAIEKIVRQQFCSWYPTVFETLFKMQNPNHQFRCLSKRRTLFRQFHHFKHELFIGIPSWAYLKTYWAAWKKCWIFMVKPTFVAQNGMELFLKKQSSLKKKQKYSVKLLMIY